MQNDTNSEVEKMAHSVASFDTSMLSNGHCIDQTSVVCIQAMHPLVTNLNGLAEKLNRLQLVIGYYVCQFLYCSLIDDCSQILGRLDGTLDFAKLVFVEKIILCLCALDSLNATASVILLTISSGNFYRSTLACQVQSFTYALFLLPSQMCLTLLAYTRYTVVVRKRE